MTQAQAPRPTLGRALGEAYRGANALHLRVLDRSGSDFPSWVVFTLLSEQGGSAPESDFAEQVARQLEVEVASGRSTIDRLTEAGYLETATVDGERVIRLTASGDAFFTATRKNVAELTSQVTASIPPADVDKAIEVLRAVRARADELLDR